MKKNMAKSKESSPLNRGEKLETQGEIPMETLTSAEIEQAIQEVLRFIKSGAVVPNKEGVVCGDGGVPAVLFSTTGERIETGGMAGDLGQDSATIPAVLTYYRRHGIAYDLYALTRKMVMAYNQVGLTFQFHTSQHVDGQEKITDCGDMNAKMVASKAPDYQTDAAEVREVVMLLQHWYRDEKPEGLLLEEQNLAEREHHEAGVILVVGKQNTLLHWIKQDLPEAEQQMYFVLDPVRAEARRRKALQAFGFDEAAIVEILAIKAEQDQMTNKYVARKAEPEKKLRNAVFAVDVDDAQDPKIEYLGLIQADGQVRK
jgi:hypothetical protein